MYVYVGRKEYTFIRWSCWVYVFCTTISKESPEKWLGWSGAYHRRLNKIVGIFNIISCPGSVVLTQLHCTELVAVTRNYIHKAYMVTEKYEHQCTYTISHSSYMHSWDRGWLTPHVGGRDVSSSVQRWMYYNVEKVTKSTCMTKQGTPIKQTDFPENGLSYNTILCNHHAGRAFARVISFILYYVYVLPMCGLILKLMCGPNWQL